MRAKRFRDLSPTGKLWASITLAVGVALVTAAQRDIQRRPSDEVNGSKAMWRLLCLNALGALAYFRWGRRVASN